MIDNAFSKIRIFVHIVGDGAENKKKCKEALLGLRWLEIVFEIFFHKKTVYIYLYYYCLYGSNMTIK